MTHLNDISKVYLESVAESAVPGKPAERLGAVTAIPKSEQDAAKERLLAKAKAKREKMKEGLDPVGQEDKDIDNDGDHDKTDKYLLKRRKAIGNAIRKRVKESRELSEIHTQAHKPHEVPDKNLKKLVSKAVKRIDTDVDGDTDHNDKAKGEFGEFITGVGNKRLHSSTKAVTAKESKYYDPMDDEDFDHDEAEKNRGVSGKNNPKGGKSLSKKKSVKEGFSNWRQDLSEVMGEGETEKKIKEKKVNNKVKINPNLGEAIEEIGGTLIEMVEIEDFDYVVESVYDELLEEGYEEDDIEEAIEFALTEAKVTFGHDTKKRNFYGGMVGATRRLAKQKLKSLGKKAKLKSAQAQVAAYNKKREAEQAASDVARKTKRTAEIAKKRASEAKGKAKSGVKSFIKRQAQKVVDRMTEEAIDENVATGKARRAKFGGIAQKVGTSEVISNTDREKSVAAKKAALKAVGDAAHKSASEKGLSPAEAEYQRKRAERKAAMAKKRSMKEDASMSPQEVALQKRKANIDAMIARKRKQELSKQTTEQPAKAMGEAAEDRLRDRRMERGGIDGNRRYDRPPARKSTNAELGIDPKAKTAAQKAAGGKSALDIVKGDIEKKYGKGAIMDTKKKEK